MSSLDPHDGWTPEVQEQEQPPVFPDGLPAESRLTEERIARLERELEECRSGR